MEASLILCTIISLVVAFGVAWEPLVQMKQGSYFTTETEVHRFDPKVALLESIDELEQDLTLGHLTQDEFDSLSLELKREYLEARSEVQTATEQS